MTEESDIRAVHPEDEHHVRFLSLKATQQELLIARREPGVEPVIVDELLKGSTACSWRPSRTSRS